MSSLSNRTFRITPRVSYTNVLGFSPEGVNGPLLAPSNTHYLYFFILFYFFTNFINFTSSGHQPRNQNQSQNPSCTVRKPASKKSNRNFPTIPHQNRPGYQPSKPGLGLSKKQSHARKLSPVIGSNPHSQLRPLNKKEPE